MQVRSKLFLVSAFVALFVVACSDTTPASPEAFENQATASDSQEESVSEVPSSDSGEVTETPQPSEEVISTTQPSDEVTETPQPSGGLSLTWTEQEIGSGIKPAMAVDKEGIIHIAYITEEEHGRVFYATNFTGSFESTVVAEGYFYGPVDIAVSAQGKPFIAYHDHQDIQFKQELGDEVVAVPSESGWELIIVQDEGHDGWDNSIVVDSNGNWHTASVDPAQFGSTSGVEYATDVGGQIGVTSIGSGPIDYEFGTSIALNNDGAAGIAYYDTEEEQLEYAVPGAGGWSIEVVDADGDAGRYASLAYDPQGNPHISYFVATSPESGLVRYARWNGTDWEIEEIDVLKNIRMGRVGARKITSLVIDADGKPHLAYTDRDRLIYAKKVGSEWSSQEVTTAGERPLGQLVELSLDSQGNPHLIWFQPTSFAPILQGTVIYASGS